MRLTPLLISTIGLLAACSPKQENAAATGTVALGIEVAQPDSGTGNPPRSSALNKSSSLEAETTKTTYQLLQGKWQSIEDAKSVIEIKEHAYIDYYAGKQLSTTAFILDRACPSASGAGHPGDNEKYLVEPREQMCWEIVGVDKDYLELNYTTRGNTLKYRHIN